MHALLVEDNPVFAQALFDLLEEMRDELHLSHVTHIADLARFEKDAPDVLLLDLALPDADGLDSLRRAQAALPGVPIVVLTADRDSERALEVVRNGAQDYLVKGALDAHGVVRSARYAIERAHGERLQRRLLQADRLAAVGRLAAGVAHEISNPAAFVQANTTLMQSHLLRAERALVRAEVSSGSSTALAALRAELLELGRIRDETAAGIDRICSVVSDLRGYTRLEGGEISEIQPNQVVNSVCQLVAGLVRHKAQLIKDLREVPAVAIAPGRLDQIVTNLLVNAAQSIVEGSPQEQRITVTTQLRDGAVVVSVEDTGSGMTDEQQRHVFEPFFSTKARGEGMGLGLSICADIVAAYGGQIRCFSSPGSGSRFEVALPAAHPAPLKASPSVPPPVAAPERLRVLLVDDEPYILQTYSILMEGEFELFTAASGAHALAQAEKAGSLDLLICDVMMPDMDASHLISQLRVVRPELASRVVLHTGGAMTESTHRLVESGEFPVLYKPLSVKELSAAIRQLAASRNDTSEPSAINAVPTALRVTSAAR